MMRIREKIVYMNETQTRTKLVLSRTISWTKSENVCENFFFFSYIQHGKCGFNYRAMINTTVHACWKRVWTTFHEYNTQNHTHDRLVEVFRETKIVLHFFSLFLPSYTIQVSSDARELREIAAACNARYTGSVYALGQHQISNHVCC